MQLVLKRVACNKLNVLMVINPFVTFILEPRIDCSAGKDKSPGTGEGVPADGEECQQIGE